MRWSFFWEVCVPRKNEDLKVFIVAAYVPLANCQIADLGVLISVCSEYRTVNVPTA